MRQSTLAQVRHHQESTERQYALREKALELGWREPSVQILDRDLGKSGAQIAGREDFKTRPKQGLAIPPLPMLSSAGYKASTS